MFNEIYAKNYVPFLANLYFGATVVRLKIQLQSTLQIRDFLMKVQSVFILTFFKLGYQ